MVFVYNTSSNKGQELPTREVIRLVYSLCRGLEVENLMKMLYLVINSKAFLMSMSEVNNLSTDEFSLYKKNGLQQIDTQNV